MGPLLALLLAAAPKVAVLDVRPGEGADPALGQYLTQVLASEVGARTGAAPLVSADIRALLGFERARRSLGCDDEQGACIVEIAGALGVDEVVHSTLAVSQGRWLLTVTRLDAHKARPLGRDAQSVARDPAALELAVRRAAFRLFGGAEPLAPAAEAPAPARQGPAAAPAEATAAAPASSGISRRTWAWIAGGAAVALGATAGALGASALSAARAGDADPARTRAHVADGLWAAAAAAAGAGLWLWLGERSGEVALAPAPGAGAPLAFQASVRF